MKLRLATNNDLPALYKVYRDIIHHMELNNIIIWDDYYPTELFKKDIQNECLYVLVNHHEEILAAFALCASAVGLKELSWKNPSANALYLERFAVNVNYLNRGIGISMLQHAKSLTKMKGIQYLRLLVVDSNTPAIKLYKKNDFPQVEGMYEEKMNEAYILNEVGFEYEIKQSANE